MFGFALDLKARVQSPKSRRSKFRLQAVAAVCCVFLLKMRNHVRNHRSAPGRPGNKKGEGQCLPIREL